MWVQSSLQTNWYQWRIISILQFKYDTLDQICRFLSEYILEMRWSKLDHTVGIWNSLTLHWFFIFYLTYHQHIESKLTPKCVVRCLYRCHFRSCERMTPHIWYIAIIGTTVELNKTRQRYLDWKMCKCIRLWHIHLRLLYASFRSNNNYVQFWATVIKGFYKK